MQLNRKLINQVLAKALTYLDTCALEFLAEAVVRTEKEGVRGDMLELGCALGGSAAVIAAHKGRIRNFHIHDVFSTIPPPSERDYTDSHARYEEISSGKATGSLGHRYYGYEPDLESTVAHALTECGFPPKGHKLISIVTGMIQSIPAWRQSHLV